MGWWWEGGRFSSRMSDYENSWDLSYINWIIFATVITTVLYLVTQMKAQWYWLYFVYMYCKIFFFFRIPKGSFVFKQSFCNKKTLQSPPYTLSLLKKKKKSSTTTSDITQSCIHISSATSPASHILIHIYIRSAEQLSATLAKSRIQWRSADNPYTVHALSLFLSRSATSASGLSTIARASITSVLPSSIQLYTIYSTIYSLAAVVVVVVLRESGETELFFDREFYCRRFFEFIIARARE